MAKVLNDKAKIAKLEAQVASLTEQLEAARARKTGIRSSGVEDKYTSMEAADLRNLVIKRGGDVDKIVKGYHARGRSIAMREWLRANPANKAAKVAAPVKKAKPEPVAVKKKAKPVEAPVKRKAKVEAPAAKPKKKPRKL